MSLSFAFLAHGLASLGFLGLNQGHIDLAMRIISEENARLFITYSGITDTIIGIMLLQGLFTRYVAIIGTIWILFIIYLSVLTAIPDAIFRLGFLFTSIYIILDTRCHEKKLIKLPNLGVYYEPLTVESSNMDFIQMGINPNATKLLCLGVPNKFSPIHDWVFIDIIRRIDDCQLIFMNDDKGASKILEKRLRARARDASIIFDRHMVFVPSQSRQGFSALMKSADLLLDTIGFSGFNTAMQAIGCGLPVVTREGRFMRTRHASAILRTLGIEELITKTETEYIDLVEKIVLDREFLRNIKYKIKDKEDFLYRNTNTIRALEDFFVSATSDLVKS